ncbi:MAG: SEL1-like repeat protein [Verrucomicrobia bacterium]|nr:SEL1-like repeat protein [Verrucomicrobiota bacterium]
MTVLEVLRNAMGRPLISRQAPTEKDDFGDIASVSVVSALLSDGVTEAELTGLMPKAYEGDAVAQFRLGMAFYRGVGVTRDHAEAFKWLTLGAEKGDPSMAQDRALIIQGMATEAVAEGRRRVASFKGEPEPPPMGLSADGERGSANATAPVLFLEPGTPKDEPWSPEARRAAALAMAAGLVLLATGGVWLAFRETVRPQTASFVATDGQSGGPRDPAAFPGGVFEPAAPEYASVSELQIAADKGEARAQFLLGLAYAKGEEMAQDFLQAVTWYQKAAEQGDANAQNNLGVCHVKATGVTLDPVTAYKWFSLAAKSGLKGAAMNRDQLALMLTGSQLAEAVRQTQAFAVRRGASLP